MYFYTSTKWDLYQDDKLCASSPATETLADEFEPERRHFLHPPLQFLQKGAWAQLKFQARGVLATAFKGEQLRDKYHVQGRTMLRIVTADGNFDYLFRIDLDVTELAF
jgi:hypothetical protein